MAVYVHATDSSIAAAPSGRLADALASRAATRWVLTLFFMLSIVLVIGLSVQLPTTGNQTVLLFDPSVSQASALDSIRRHGGQLVGIGISDSLVVAVFDRDIGWSAMHDMRVLASVDPTSLLGCIVAP